MASNYETLDDEIKELLENYKHKRSSVYEPCKIGNIKECLIGLREELGVFNISYLFNPYNDIEDEILLPGSLVTLINSIWTLLHYHKNAVQKVEKLMEQNHILEQNNKQLNSFVDKLKEKVSSEKSETRACVVSAQRIADHSDVMLQTLTETKAKLLQVTKQKKANERNYHNEITRLKIQNEKMLDRLRNREPPCTETCDSTLIRLKEKDKQHRTMISKLEKNNQDLLHELLNLKEALLLEGLNDMNINNDEHK